MVLEIRNKEIHKPRDDAILAFKEYQKSLSGRHGPCDEWNYDFKTNQIGYKFFSTVFKWVSKLFYKIEVHGVENIPKDTNVIFMANHVSHLDGPLLSPYFPGAAPVVMGDEKLFKAKWFRIFSEIVNIFPIRKGSRAIEIVDYAISRVNSGDSFLIFPEGQRHKNPSENSCNRGKLGAGKLAQGTNVPVVPIFIGGAEFAMPVGKRVTLGLGLRSLKISLRFGYPVYLDDLRQLNSCKETSIYTVDRIMNEIDCLRSEGPYVVQKSKNWQKPKLSHFLKINNPKPRPHNDEK